MALLAAVGKANALDGREAGLQAAHQALNGLGSVSPILGIVASSYQYEAQQVVNGIAGLIGNTPVIGFSTPAGLTSEGLQPHSVVLALIGATDARADITWLAGYTQGSREVSQQLADLVRRHPQQPALLFADGFNADAEQFCNSLPAGTNLAGALSSGDLNSGNAYQIGGAQFGAGGLALTRLEGNIRIGVGYGAGWQPVGTHFRITRSRGFWVRTLDGRPCSEIYAHLFGYPARDWAFPPLNHMARLYPLGLEQADKSLLLRSPMRVEADGSFRMNASVGDGTEAYLMLGSLTACQQAATAATEQALAALEGARPVLALVLADIAWQMLFEARLGADVAAVQAALGADIPLAGGYTLGQIVPRREASPQFLNQHMVVIVFGEAKEEK
ncbi:MAG TPA: FIST N-terminal domain-containing protein [Anaerolineales bacterium]|nr:FIST N-terminal domain-containing protein [Anaerolineales bacterium]